MTPNVRMCLNTGTIRGQKRNLAESIGIAAEAGYDGIEPWIDEIQQSERSGTPVRDLKRMLADRGVRVESAIGFAEWIVDDPERRRSGMEQMKRDMDLVRQIGGNRIAAPPAGATEVEGMPTAVIAERYRAILDLGQSLGVTPQLEIWGFSRTLGRLSEAVAAILETDRPDACLLADIYHLHRGGSGFAGLRFLNAATMHVFHMNDYPSHPPREALRDSDRVLPGDGAAPLDTALAALISAGFAGALSLEIFNEAQWKRPALDVARDGIARMRALVARHASA